MFGGSKIKKATWSKLLSSYQLEGAMSTFILGGKPSQILPARPIKLVFSPNLGEVFG